MHRCIKRRLFDGAFGFCTNRLGHAAASDFYIVRAPYFCAHRRPRAVRPSRGRVKNGNRRANARRFYL